MKKILAVSALALALAGCQSTQQGYYQPTYVYQRPQPMVVPVYRPLERPRPVRVCHPENVWNPQYQRYVRVERCNMVYR